MLKKIFSTIICVAMLLTLSTSAFAHGVFFDVSDMHTAVGQEVTVQIGWGYIHLGHDGSNITNEANFRGIFVTAPDGTETRLPFRVFHQYQGRDYPNNPIRQIPLAQVGTDEFPTGGRNLTYIEVAFTPQSEGYYQVFFLRDRTIPTEGANEGRLVRDLVKTYVRVGNPQPTEAMGHGRISRFNSTEIRPVSDVGRLTTGGTFEGYVLFRGQPVANQEVSLEIGAHEYVTVNTNAQGRFILTLPAEAGDYAIRVTRDWNWGGPMYGQTFTYYREVHILQIAVQ